MGTGAREYLAGREVFWPPLPADGVSFSMEKSGWYRPYQHSPEFLLYKSGNSVGEVYPAAHETVWFARLYGGHNAREFDTVGEAMLYIEAIGALID